MQWVSIAEGFIIVLKVLTKVMGYIKVIIIVLLHADNMADSVLLYPRQVADGSPGVSLFCCLLHQDNTRTVH